MLMAKARLIGEANGRITVGLSLPTGFDPEEVVQDSILGNGSFRPEEIHVEPRRGKLFDIIREFEVSFPKAAVVNEAGGETTLKITGKLRRGLPFSALVPLSSDSHKNPPTDH